ncbi:MAG: hypothetical protein V3U65_18310 [Granulosicoccaceae bacterium]
MSGSTAQYVRGGCCFVFNGAADLSSYSDLRVEHDMVSITSSILSAINIDSQPYKQNLVATVVDAINTKLFNR